MDLPALSATSSLLCGAMRRDRPAAITTAAMIGAVRGAAPERSVAGAFSRGSGRVSASCSSPPTPMRMMSEGVTLIPANSRDSTKSIPFNTGLRAHPGSTSAGLSCSRPTQIRLPGSTGMPKCRISPPARTMPAGPTSRRSTTAEAPITSSISAPSASSLSSALATDSSS